MPLDAFTWSYIDTALGSSNDNSTPSGGEPLDKNYDIEDFDEASLQHIIRDCKKFQRENAVDVAAAAELGEYAKSQYSADGMAGHDFWLTRVGHGAGFWDRDLGDVGERLTEAAQQFGSADIYVYGTELVYSAPEQDLYEGLWGPIRGTWTWEPGLP